jgi:hypothetical protein
VIAVGAFGLLAGAASAAPTCKKSAEDVTCTYTAGLNRFKVPNGVASIHVVAVGGAGGNGAFMTNGGPGARVEADLAVASRSTLYAVVGGNGSTRAAGANEGGTGGVSGICPFLPDLPACLDGTAGDGGGGGGGGGGGSNLVPPGGSASVDTTGTPLVQISYRHRR